MRLFRPSQVVRYNYESEAGPQNDRLCVFAHNDRWNRVDPHVLHYLSNLKEAGFDVLFITTCNSLPQEDVRKTLEFCFRIIIRKNIGYDFGSYQLGLKENGHDSRYHRILLANDSVYGPFHSLVPLIDEMEKRDRDIWGVTDSLQHEYHLQTYFLMMTRECFEHSLMQRFWMEQEFARTRKQDIIKLYEIGFSRACKKAGFRTGAWCPYREVARIALEDLARRLVKLNASKTPEDINASNITDFLAEEQTRVFARNLLTKPCNPSHELWNYLITDCRCPFIKVELLKKNPVGVRNLWMLDSILPNGYPVSLIRDHLHRVG